MKKIFEPLENFELYVVNDTFDGVPVWETYEIKGRKITETAGLASAETPELYCSAVFLIPPDSRIPAPGNRIKYHGLTYDVSAVEKKTDLKGNFIAARCVCGKM